MPSQLPSVKQCNELAGKRVLLRATLNVPVEDGIVTNQFRITRALPTINFLKQAGARVIMIGHIGRDPEHTLKPVHDILGPLVGAKWCSDFTGSAVESAIAQLADGEVLLLENTRSDERETAGDMSLAEELSTYADLYVNDAFAVSHREHVSVTHITTQLPTYFGFNFIHEYEELGKAMNPQAPSLFLLGGAKFDTKLPLIDKYANEYTNVFIGGALANDMFKAKGYNVGTSLCSDIDLRETAVMNHLNILLPVDVTVQGPDGVRVITPDDVKDDEAILDAGPQTIEMLEPYVTEAKNILWNGPLGNYENGFAAETEALAKAVAASDAYAIVGGGDTIAAIESLCLQEKFGFLSTAGGAMLTFLEHGTLPAIEAVRKKQ